jgi:hypothetical protein
VGAVLVLNPLLFSNGFLHLNRQLSGAGQAAFCPFVKIKRRTMKNIQCFTFISNSVSPIFTLPKK